MKKEIWKDIPGYENMYQVSDLGKVRSVDRVIIRRDGKKYTSKGKILKQNTDRYGYNYVNLRKDYNQKSFIIHNLVTSIFIGEKPKGYEVCHIDSNKKNNSIYNLRYDTKRENAIDHYRNGNKKENSKLNIDEVLQIRHKYKNKQYNKKELSKLYNVSPWHINAIINKDVYDWLLDDGCIKESNTSIYE